MASRSPWISIKFNICSSFVELLYHYRLFCKSMRGDPYFKIYSKPASEKIRACSESNLYRAREKIAGWVLREVYILSLVATLIRLAGSFGKEIYKASMSDATLDHYRSTGVLKRGTLYHINCGSLWNERFLLERWMSLAPFRKIWTFILTCFLLLYLWGCKIFSRYICTCMWVFVRRMFAKNCFSLGPPSAAVFLAHVAQIVMME